VPENKKLEIWVGNWTYEGDQSHAAWPRWKVTGKHSVRPILGGFFVEFRGEEKALAGLTEWVEIDGYDPVTKQFTWTSFDSGGGFQTVTAHHRWHHSLLSGTQVVGGSTPR
jgi:hypothetical protein